MLICYQISELESYFYNLFYFLSSNAYIIFFLVILHPMCDYEKFKFLMLIHIFFLTSNFSQEEDVLTPRMKPPKINTTF